MIKDYVLYLCDRKDCLKCDSECHMTTNKEHAICPERGFKTSVETRIIKTTGNRPILKQILFKQIFDGQEITKWPEEKIKNYILKEIYKVSNDPMIFDYFTKIKE